MPEERYMRRAIELAKKGSGRVNPNPLVGAVIVKDGRILGEGYHARYGDLHAERNAIVHAKSLGHDIAGSTIYVTLEPCSHYGKQPPCALALIEEKVARVVVGSDDPNPLVSGRGIRMLREKGIEVTTQFLKEECDAINDVFFHFITEKTPYVAMKYAMTMDGKIACYTGDSRWVTGEESRAYVQELRNHYMGIMAGIGTVLADDPMLNCRLEGGRDPVRIICDDHLRIPLDSKLVRTAKDQPVIVACLPPPEYDGGGSIGSRSDDGGSDRSRSDDGGSDRSRSDDGGSDRSRSEGSGPDRSRSDGGGSIGSRSDDGGSDGRRSDDSRSEIEDKLRAAGVEILHIPAGDNGCIDLNILMQELGKRSIDGILLEGGGILNESALAAGIVQKVYCFMAPKIFGGRDARTPVEGQGLALAADAWRFERTGYRFFGEDIMLEYRRMRTNKV